MTGSTGRRHVSRRMLAGVAGLTLLVGGCMLPSVQATDAAFSDTEFTSTTLQAATLETPVITSCSVTTGVLGGFSGFTITWTSPYPKAQERLSINGKVVDNATVMQSGTGPYSYSSTTSAAILGALLGSLLGSSNTVTVEAIAGTAWVSPAASRTLSIGGLLGLGGTNTCT